jgi:S1-C subfamily serine protease
MSSSQWELPASVQPKPEHYDYDLDAALSSVVGLRAVIPNDAFTAEILGTERAGNGVLIGRGVVLTIGYLITEAQTIWLHLFDGTAVPGHVLAYDQETGFGLVQALASLDLPALPLGESSRAQIGDPVVVAGAGGRKHSIVARIAAKEEFAGNWEYVLDEAIFTAPAHPFWGGTAMIDHSGGLLGIGSLQVQQVRQGGSPDSMNMVVPIDLLKPILQDLLTRGRPNRPARP